MTPAGRARLVDPRSPQLDDIEVGDRDAGVVGDEQGVRYRPPAARVEIDGLVGAGEAGGLAGWLGRHAEIHRAGLELRLIADRLRSRGRGRTPSDREGH